MKVPANVYVLNNLELGIGSQMHNILIFMPQMYNVDCVDYRKKEKN